MDQDSIGFKTAQQSKAAHGDTKYSAHPQLRQKANSPFRDKIDLRMKQVEFDSPESGEFLKNTERMLLCEEKA